MTAQGVHAELVHVAVRLGVGFALVAVLVLVVLFFAAGGHRR